MRIRKTFKQTIPHGEHRYSTCGDFWIDELGVKHVRVSDMDDERYEFLVGIHEEIEEFLTRLRGLSEPEILAFDLMFEAERAQGLHRDDEEPGFDPRCIYRQEHTIATGIEMILAGIMGIDWQEYSEKVNSLGQPQELQPPEGSQPNL